MTRMRFVSMLVLAVFVAVPASAQPPAPAAAATPPPPPPPLWDSQIGASFVGTKGNWDTASTGAAFSAHRGGLIWQIGATATRARTDTDDPTTAERSLGLVRVQRNLTPIMGLS